MKGIISMPSDVDGRERGSEVICVDVVYGCDCEEPFGRMKMSLRSKGERSSR